MTETNYQLELANKFINETSLNIFLTGKAGTGKTTFLRNLKKNSFKRIILVAPTGIAAINAGGVTIHSFFQLPFSPFIPGNDSQRSNSNKFSKEKINIIRSIDTLVIDEISMVRSDLLDAIDEVLRRYRSNQQPFGGVQLVMIGDVQQLAPVVKDEEWRMLSAYYSSPYFFHSLALNKAGYVPIELKKVYRQQDLSFVEILNAIRNKSLNDKSLAKLNERYIPDFKAGENEGYITLTTHNAQAGVINSHKLDEIKEEKFTYKARIEGDFPQYSYPTNEILDLKIGAQVMFVKNDPSPEKLYFNGKIGKICKISDEEIIVESEGRKIAVTPIEWQNTKYVLDPETNEIKENVEGKFIQHPLRTAWAITIHKSQGLTFDKVIINVSQAFTHGQVYVALSRCRTLEGIVLLSPISNQLVKRDDLVDRFNDYVCNNEPDNEVLSIAHRKFFMDLISELFDFRTLYYRIEHYTRLCDENLSMLYPSYVNGLNICCEETKNQIYSVGISFINQLQNYIGSLPDYETNEIIKDRVRKGVTYFLEKIDNIISSKLGSSAPLVDNKELKKSLNSEYDMIIDQMSLKNSCLISVSDGFVIDSYLKAKAMASIINDRRKNIKAKKETEKVLISDDIENAELYERLRIWRKNRAEELNIPAYTIFQQKALIGLSNRMPDNTKELLSIPGIGKKIAEKFGEELLEIIRDYKTDKSL